MVVDSTLWRWWIKSSVKIKRRSVRFCPNNWTMPLHLYGWESLFKSMHKATMRSHLFFWKEAVLSERCKHSNNLRMSFLFVQYSVKDCRISFGLLAMRTLYINNYGTSLLPYVDNTLWYFRIFAPFAVTLYGFKITLCCFVCYVVVELHSVVLELCYVVVELHSVVLELRYVVLELRYVALQLNYVMWFRNCVMWLCN